jgi:hypothetical protein
VEYVAATNFVGIPDGESGARAGDCCGLIRPEVDQDVQIGHTRSKRRIVVGGNDAAKRDWLLLARSRELK